MITLSLSTHIAICLYLIGFAASSMVQIKMKEILGFSEKHIWLTAILWPIVFLVAIMATMVDNNGD